RTMATKLHVGASPCNGTEESRTEKSLRHRSSSLPPIGGPASAKRAGTECVGSRGYSGVRSGWPEGELLLPSLLAELPPAQHQESRGTFGHYAHPAKVGEGSRRSVPSRAADAARGRGSDSGNAQERLERRTQDVYREVLG